MRFFCFSLFLEATQRKTARTTVAVIRTDPVATEVQEAGIGIGLGRRPAEPVGADAPQLTVSVIVPGVAEARGRCRSAREGWAFRGKFLARMASRRPVGAPARRKGSFSLLSSQLQLSRAERHPRAAPKVRNRSNAFLAFERFRWRAVKKRFFFARQARLECRAAPRSRASAWTVPVSWGGLASAVMAGRRPGQALMPLLGLQLRLSRPNGQQNARRARPYGSQFLCLRPNSRPPDSKNYSAQRSLSARQRNLVQTRTLRLNDFAT